MQGPAGVQGSIEESTQDDTCRTYRNKYTKHWPRKPPKKDSVNHIGNKFREQGPGGFIESRTRIEKSEHRSNNYAMCSPSLKMIGH